MISIEVPVYYGGFLIQCIDSVLKQSSHDWELLLLWNDGDEVSKKILEKINDLNNPKINVLFFEQRQGIGKARQFLTDHSKGEFVFPVNDNEILDINCIQLFFNTAKKASWSGIIRARRKFIDIKGQIIDTKDHVSFCNRHYANGMTLDLKNFASPYIIRRSIFNKTSGWDVHENMNSDILDADIFSKMEELSEIELMDNSLIYCRLNQQSTYIQHLSDHFFVELSDKILQRRNLLLDRTNTIMPFTYKKAYHSSVTCDMLDIVIPFWESNEKELFYSFNRMSTQLSVSNKILYHHSTHQETFPQPLDSFDRFEIFCSSDGPVHGTLEVAFYTNRQSTSPDAIAQKKITDTHLTFEPISMNLKVLKDINQSKYQYMEVVFHSERKNQHIFLLHLLKPKNMLSKYPNILMRLFKKCPNNSVNMLNRCVSSVKEAGIDPKSIFIINKQQSCSQNRNEGISLCSKPYICFIDDDVEIIKNNTFEILLQQLSDTKSDMIGPKIVDPKGKIFCVDPYFNKDLMPVARGLGESDIGQYNYSSTALWLPTTYLLTTLETCLSIGGFDENYPGSQIEDVDFCLKARSRGFTCYYYGEMSVRHYNCFRNSFFVKNFKYFLDKWSHNKNLFQHANAEILN